MDPKPNQHELTDIEVDEISLVDEAANARTFAIAKSAGAGESAAGDGAGEGAPSQGSTAAPSGIEDLAKRLDGLGDRVAERVLTELAKMRQAAQVEEVTKAREDATKAAGEAAALKADLAKAGEQIEQLKSASGAVETAKAALAAEVAQLKTALEKAKADAAAEVAQLNTQIETLKTEKAALEKAVPRQQGGATGDRTLAQTRDDVWPIDLAPPTTRRPNRAGDNQ